MQKLTLSFTHNIEWLWVDPTTFFHALVQKVEGNNRNFVLESRTTFEWVLSSVSVVVRCQQTTLSTTTFLLWPRLTLRNSISLLMQNIYRHNLLLFRSNESIFTTVVLKFYFGQNTPTTLNRQITYHLSMYTVVLPPTMCYNTTDTYWPHRRTMCVDVAHCYKWSSVVCQ